jgi:hypothetical protein
MFRDGIEDFTDKTIQIPELQDEQDVEKTNPCKMKLKYILVAIVTTISFIIVLFAFLSKI